MTASTVIHEIAHAIVYDRVHTSFSCPRSKSVCARKSKWWLKYGSDGGPDANLNAWAHNYTQGTLRPHVVKHYTDVCTP